MNIEKELAIALRIGQETPEKAYDALWCVAFNAGLRGFGSNCEPFNPREHEDTRGGLLPGDVCSAVRQGWKTKDGAIILRATVE